MRGWSDSESQMGGKYQLKRQVAISGAVSSFRRTPKAGGAPPAARSQSAYRDDRSQKAKESAPKEKTAEGDVKTDAKDKEVLRNGAWEWETSSGCISGSDSSPTEPLGVSCV